MVNGMEFDRRRADLQYLPLLGLAIVFSSFTIAAVVRHGQEDLKDQIVKIAKAHFDRQDHEESLK